MISTYPFFLKTPLTVDGVESTSAAIWEGVSTGFLVARAKLVTTFSTQASFGVSDFLCC